MTEKTQQQRKQRQIAEQGLPNHEIAIGKQDAAQWLLLLNQWIGQQPDSSGKFLEKLRNRLEDGAWLACWKRERLCVELCPSDMAEIVEVLSTIGQGDMKPGDLQVLEEMIRLFSGHRGP